MSSLAGVFSSSGGGGGVGNVKLLTSNTGGPVPPDSITGNINVVGDGTTITGVGNPGTNTITFSTTGSIPDTFNADSGSAVPLAGILVIAGGTGITTSASGHTVTINASGGSGINTIDGDSGSVTGSTVSIKTGVSTQNSGSTISIDAVSATDLVLNVTDLLGNTIIGNISGNATLSGGNNTALGASILSALTTGVENVMVGSASGNSLTTGSVNIGIGFACLSSSTTSNNNIAIGQNAGSTYTTESNNICLGGGVNGVVGDNAVIRILDTGATACFIGGIDGVDLATANVVTELGNQLGTAVITGGTGITIDTTTPNEIIINASGGGGGISTINGDSGSVTGATVSIVHTANQGTASFSGASTTLTFTLTDGQNNIGIGTSSLHNVVGSANNNIGIGDGALGLPPSTGTGNIGIGNSVGASLSTGDHNVLIGYQTAGPGNLSTGSNNVMIGANCGGFLTSGSGNTLLGDHSGDNFGGTEAFNIFINDRGAGGEANALKIGTAASAGSAALTSAFIGGITGVVVTGAAVLVSGSDQLGVAASSRKFKENIHDLGDSSAIYKLRPVSFNYNQGEDRSLQSGLIAEEVHEVMPQLVVYDKQGEPQTVKYHDLPVLLLNEIQKLRKEIDELKRSK